MSDEMKTCSACGRTAEDVEFRLGSCVCLDYDACIERFTAQEQQEESLEQRTPESN